MGRSKSSDGQGQGFLTSKGLWEMCGRGLEGLKQCLWALNLGWMWGKVGLGVLAASSSPEAAKTLKTTSQNGRCRETSKC